jgi:hypothetical protein
MQDIDIINLLIKSAESVFNTSLQLSNKEGIVFLLKVSNNKRINLTQNTLKKISIIFENNLKDTNKIIQINSAKKLLKNRDIFFSVFCVKFILLLFDTFSKKTTPSLFESCKEVLKTDSALLINKFIISISCIQYLIDSSLIICSNIKVFNYFISIVF